MTKSLQFLNNTSITRGKHAFRFGAEVRRDQYNQDGNRFGRGNFSFSTTPTWAPPPAAAGMHLRRSSSATLHYPELPRRSPLRSVDVRNRFLNLVAGWWQLGSIVTWRSGFPLNPSAGVNRANTNINVDRPDATGISQSLENRSTAKWFNVVAFALAPFYSFGNAAHNSVTAPPGFTLDFSGHRDFRIREGHALKFRMEAFNFLNHPV